MELRFRHIIGDYRERKAMSPLEALWARTGGGFEVGFEGCRGAVGAGDDANIQRLEEPPEYLRPPYGVPDIFMVYADVLALLAERNLIAPMDAVVDELGRDDFHAGLLDSVSWRGRVWGLPIEANPYALFINDRLFAEAGIESDPADWSELEAAAFGLMLDADADGVRERFGYTQCTFQVPLLMWQAGCEIMDPAGTEIRFGTDAGAEALLFHSRIRDTSPPHVDFEKNDVGMKLSIIENLVKGRYDHLDFHTVKLPAGRFEANSYAGSCGALCLAVGRSTPEREAAAGRFAAWFASEPAAMLWSTATGYIPVRRSLLDCGEWLEFMEANPKMEPFLESLAVARGRPCCPAARQVTWIVAQATHEGRRKENHSFEAASRIMKEHAQLAQAVLDGEGFFRPGRPGLDPRA